jgi:predicted metal-dependent enzyme (double-stranded beta helix superfamily)
MSTGITKLDVFIAGLTRVIESARGEVEIIRQATPLLRRLVAEDDWLSPELAVPETNAYCQHLLYRDPDARFSVVSFVWGPGQKTPVHDHLVWGLIGMLRGAEDETRYSRKPDGTLAAIGLSRLRPGQVEAVSPRLGDIHQVSNAFADQISVSIHVYGADIATVSRHTYDPTTGEKKNFISGYSNAGVSRQV